MECSENYCENDGKCLVMSGSVHELQENTKQSSNLDFGFFVTNGNQQNWYKANASCKENGGKLFLRDDSTLESNIAAQIFIQNYVSDDKVSGFWTGFSPDSENKCYLLDQYGFMTRKSCSDTYDIETGGLYVGLCQHDQFEGKS